MGKTSIKIVQRLRRKRSIRKRVFGSSERPRLCVFKSARHIYAQIVDDVKGHTIAAASSLAKDERGALAAIKPTEAAKKVGLALAARCKAAGIEQVVFDRNGFRYHGRIKAVADGAREGGLQF